MHQKPGTRSAVPWLAGMLLAIALLSACGGATAPAAPAPTAAPSGDTATSTAPNAPASTAAPQPTEAAQPAAAGELNRDPKTLVIANTESPDNADPAQTLNAANSLLQRGMYEGLLTLKGSSLSEVDPVLA